MSPLVPVNVPGPDQDQTRIVTQTWTRTQTKIVTRLLSKNLQLFGAHNLRLGQGFLSITMYLVCLFSKNQKIEKK